MLSDARRAPIFQNFLVEDTQTPRQRSRLGSFAVAGCAKLSPSKKFHSPIKILDLATGPSLTTSYLRLLQLNNITPPLTSIYQQLIISRSVPMGNF